MNIIISILFTSSISFAQSSVPSSPATQQTNSKSKPIGYTDFKASQSNAAKPDQGTTKITGTPRLVRENPAQQVFFNEFSETYTILSNNTSYRIMNALYDGLRTKKPVTVLVDIKTRSIVDLDQPLVEEKRPTVAEEDIYVGQSKQDEKKEQKIPPPPPPFVIPTATPGN